MIARYVTHISDELEPIKGVCYGQIGTYVVIMYEYMYCLSQIMWNTTRISNRVYYQIDHTLSCTIQLC